MKIELIKSEEWDKTFWKVVTDDPCSVKYFTTEREAELFYNMAIETAMKPPVLTVLKSIEI